MLSVQSLIGVAGTAKRAGSRAEPAAEDACLREAIEALPDSQRVALALRYYESASMSVIAAVLDLKEEETHRLLVSAAETVTEHLRRADGASPPPAPTHRRETA